jgi:dipeptidyl aminopeptidase/acylaminoacyl peptidase
MKRITFSLLAMLIVLGCKPKDEVTPTHRVGVPSATPSATPSPNPPELGDSLVEARKGFKTKIVRTEKGDPAPKPPQKDFQLVKYDAPPGKMSAYLTPDPKDGKKHPAIVWITGGDCNSIDEGCWKAGPASDDQSAGQYRKAGIVMMFPSLRGGNDNPGVKESFLGEVDDILAAADFLAKQTYVDPARIYLGGHSTGGTMVLLVSECSDRFRAVFSFGPTNDVAGYPPQFITFDRSNAKEGRLRSPGYWLGSIKSPTFVMEGTKDGNINALRVMAGTSKNVNAHFLTVNGATHFSILAPANKLIAEKILRDDGATCNLSIMEPELNRLFGK